MYTSPKSVDTTMDSPRRLLIMLRLDNDQFIYWKDHKLLRPRKGTSFLKCLFAAMEELDGDEVRLNEGGRSASRDIVQVMFLYQQLALPFTLFLSLYYFLICIVQIDRL